jgi:hypothetical protein
MAPFFLMHGPFLLFHGPFLLQAKVWLVRVGRVRLYLLDCNVEGNRPEDRELTCSMNEMPMVSLDAGSSG